jgi:hypothetical protein
MYEEVYTIAGVSLHLYPKNPVSLREPLVVMDRAEYILKDLYI